MSTIQSDDFEKMLPCPFCGGEPKIEQNSRNGFKLNCKSCLMGYTQKTLRNSLDWLKAKMIENWNARTVSADTQRDLEGSPSAGVWISVNERLPKGNLTDTYFVKQKIKDSDESWFPGTCTFSCEWEIDDMYEVTHWLSESLSIPTESEKDKRTIRDMVESIFGKEAAEDNNIVSFYEDVNKEALNELLEENKDLRKQVSELLEKIGC